MTLIEKARHHKACADQNAALRDHASAALLFALGVVVIACVVTLGATAYAYFALGGV